MTAPELLAEVESRGGHVVVAHDATGVVALRITPRGLVPDLLPELARFKPALLELLITPDDDVARARVMPALAQCMDDDDVVQLGRLLLKLDAGEEIE